MPLSNKTIKEEVISPLLFLIKKLLKMLRIRPKSDFIHTATWESLYVLGEHWQSDIQFYKDELRFLDDLIGKYFIWMTKDENIASVKKMSIELHELREQINEVDGRLATHMHQLSEMMEDVMSKKGEGFRIEQEKLEDDLEDFAKEFRTLKKAIFTITEHVIESEKFQHLLTT